MSRGRVWREGLDGGCVACEQGEGVEGGSGWRVCSL